RSSGEIRCTTSVSVGELLVVVTPRRCTSGGRRGSACATRFCTNCCALSGSTPSLKCTVTARLPSLLACDCMYSMSSTPLIDSSSGEATVAAITLGLAPGYCARTTTEGGTTSGYSEMGSWNMANRPASSTATDSTPAKIGRSMKNLEIFMLGFRGLFQVGRGGLYSGRRRVHGHEIGGDHFPGAHTLQPVDHDALACLQAAGDDAQVALGRAERHLAVGRAVVVVHHQHEALVLVGADGPFLNQHGVVRPGAAQANARIHAGHQQAVGVVEHGAHADRARRGVDTVVH